MALGPLVTYVPPGVYTRTLSEANAANLVAGLRIPVLIGVGQEELEQLELELIRGSSSNLDQQILSENVSSRFVVNETNPANPILGATDGNVTKFRVRNFPIVDGNGFGRITNDVRSVSVTVNGIQVSVGSVQGANGYVILQTPPQAGDDVRCTYYFRRTDTLFSDNVSSQVTTTQAELTSPAYGPFTVVAGISDVFIILVDGTSYTINLTAGSHSALTLKTQIDSALVPGLGTTVFTDNAGQEHITFVAARQIVIGTGSANGVFGFTAGNQTDRTSVFRVFQRPIVDGTDGGITTTDTTKVTVLVNNVQVIPTVLDGTNGLVTLAVPPAPGATVSIQYYANTWQNTFDYLPNTLVTNVIRCGFSPGRNDFIENQDFVVENPSADVSIVHWGTSVSVQPGVTAVGSTPFGSTQVIPTLVDDKIYLAETERYVDASVVPALVSSTQFILPEVPTTGNGRDTPLGQSLYNTVSNNRIGLPSNRPDLVQVWAGRDVNDAKSRSALTVLEVDSSTRIITLREAVPPDQNVYATFNYSRIADDTITLTNKVTGAAGVGEFEVYSSVQGRNLHQVRFGTKTGLPEIVQWPRGSELITDAFHTGAGTPANEQVTVTFGSSLANNASYTNEGQAPYSFFAGTSDQFRLNFNGTAFAVDLDAAAPAALVSGHIEVNGSDQVTIVTGENDELNFTIDGTAITVTFAAGATTISDLVDDINAAIDGTVPFSPGPNNLAAFQRIGPAGGDHIITISGANTPSALPAGFDEDYFVRIDQGTAENLLGFTAFQRANATITATNKPATLLGEIAGPFNITSGVNDELNVQVDGVDYTVTLPSGAAVTAAAAVVAINAVITGVSSVGTGDNLNKIRLTSQITSSSSRIVIKPGTANTVLGFTSGDTAAQTLVTAQEVVNNIMAFAGVVAEGFVYVNEVSGQSYIAFESLDVGLTTPSVSSISFADGANSAFNVTTGVGIVPGTSGDNGEDAEDNFVVTSNNANGSAGTGVPGQTYTDETTGLRFTILPSTTGDYTDTGFFTMNVAETWIANPTVPYLSVPGLELVVTDTVGVTLENTAVLQTFNPGGLEPSIGDSYFISYRFMKQDFSTRLFSQFKTIEENFGTLSPENRVTLASYLMILNGAILVGIKQVLKEPNSNQASNQSFVAALKDLEKPLPGNVRPDVIMPLATNTAVYSATLQHVEKMSLIRNQSERMGYIGFASGTGPTTAQAVARSLESNRMVAVYPDGAIITLTDELGSSYNALVDGTFVAAALAGSAVSPAYDVATPYTRRRIQGFTSLPRILDPVEANQTAVSGVTLFEDLDPLIRVRQGFTTDMGTILTRLPTVTQIADFVQQQSRSSLDIYIGTKFLASRTNDVEVSLTAMFKQLVQAEIVGAFTGIKASVDPEDPTILRVEAFYQPIFPLLYIVITFNLRAQI